MTIVQTRGSRKTKDNDMYTIINYAIGAASGHNMQPWLIKITDDNIVQLYADMNKTLPVIDKDNYQLLMSQGTFIGKFVEGAQRLGYETDVDYANINLDDEMPLIAAMKIELVNN